jgi:WhiB family redox-sensing transcriptional regulator
VNTDWRLRAACTPADFLLFFGADNEKPRARRTREAKAADICWACPSRKPCLEFAQSRRIGYGVFGGMGEEDRRSLMARQPGPVRMCSNNRHLMDKQNTYVNPSGGKVCRGCRNESERRVRAERRQREEVAA